MLKSTERDVTLTSFVADLSYPGLSNFYIITSPGPDTGPGEGAQWWTGAWMLLNDVSSMVPLPPRGGRPPQRPPPGSAPVPWSVTSEQQLVLPVIIIELTDEGLCRMANWSPICFVDIPTSNELVPPMGYDEWRLPNVLFNWLSKIIDNQLNSTFGIRQL